MGMGMGQGQCIGLTPWRPKSHGSLARFPRLAAGKIGPMTDSSEEIQPAPGYAGDISPELACRWWQAREAVLVDVRTSAEIAWVGFVPGSVHVPIKEWPTMAANPRFDEQVLAAVPPGGKVVFLCRSGVRSIAAAERATDLGFTAFNILEGFEGDPDAQAHRGTLGGWRARGLPWAQN